MRISLEGAEVAAKITGAGAKQIAILLYAILRGQKKTKGKIRLSNLLRSGKELKVFAVKDADLRRFCTEAKKYGVLYCILKDRDATDGITDIMVRAEDASKINRIFERFDFATVDIGEVKSEIERSRAEKQPIEPETPVGSGPMTGQEMEELLDALLAPAQSQGGELPSPERTAKGKDADEQFLASMLEPSPTKEEGQTQNPTEARIAKSRQSEPTSRPKEPTDQGISEPQEHSRPSVRQALKEIKAEQRDKSAAQGKAQPKPKQSAQHKAPPKKKSKKPKER